MTNAVLETRVVASRPFGPSAAVHTLAAVLGAKWLRHGAWERRDQPIVDVSPRPAGLWVTPWSLMPTSEEVQLEQMRGDLTGRLRRVCADMPSQEFATLVSDICARKLRWANNALTLR